VKLLIIALTFFCASQAFAQQQDPARLAPYYQQQRNSANDSVAACAVMASELQARIADLEKKLAEATAAQNKQGN